MRGPASPSFGMTSIFVGCICAAEHNSVCVVGVIPKEVGRPRQSFFGNDIDKDLKACFPMTRLKCDLMFSSQSQPLQIIIAKCNPKGIKL